MTSTRLRPVDESDLLILYEFQLDPEATAMAAFPSRDREAFYAHSMKIMADKSVFYKAIVFNGRVAGSIVSWGMDGKWEVGYWLGREFWGRGIASEALRQFLGVVKTRPLYAHVAKHNIGSKRVLEKNGFKVIQEDWYNNPAGDLVEEYLFRLDRGR